MSIFDFRIAGDGYVTISAATAADTSAKEASGGVFDDSITGYLDGCISIITAANTSRSVTAGRFNRAAAYFNVRVTGITAHVSLTAADTGSISTNSSNRAASDGDLTGFCTTTANTSTKVSTRCGQTASVIVVVLNGQLAAGHISFAVYGLIVLKTGVFVAALQLVVAIQLNGGVTFAGHAHGGLALFAGIDVHILECDLNLIVLIFGVDGHGVGRSAFLTICDDGVRVIFGGILVLGDVVAALARRNRNVTIFDVPCPCKGRGGKGGEHCGGQDKRRCPLRGRTG